PGHTPSLEADLGSLGVNHVAGLKCKRCRRSGPSASPASDGGVERRVFTQILEGAAHRREPDLETNPTIQILPLSVEIAQEVVQIGRAFRDPADRVIAATARIHGLRLLTSDQRILESDLVQTID
ncbi:MAG TPA: PIN domain-containing protein, partial [Bryobacteraceae bacterium]|nr:PIN domain-containing protein [Bryobacteraceae bacterium]